MDGPGSQLTCTCLPGYSGALCEVRQDRCGSATCGLFSACVDVYTTGQVQCYCHQGFETGEAQRLCVLSLDVFVS